MKTRILSFRHLLFNVFLIIGASCFFCTTSQLPVEEETPISLSLITEGQIIAQYTGVPIKVLITSKTPFVYDALQWIIPNGIISQTNYAATAQLKSAETYIYWMTLPTTLDSSTAKPYKPYADIYVTYQGNVSNHVKVTIYNLAPVIDSIRVGDTTFLVNTNVYGKDSSYNYSWRGLKNIAMRIYLHDLYVGTPQAGWTAAANGRLGSLFYSPTNSLIATYTSPSIDYRDTISIKVRDGQGADLPSININLYQRFTPNRPPVIDSFAIGDTVFHGMVSGVCYYATRIDTLFLRAYIHDLDTGDARHYRWRVSPHTTFLSPLSTDSSRATYMCNGTFCTAANLYDTLIDTVRLITTDALDSADTAKIILVKKGSNRVNRPPVIDSIKLDGIMYRNPGLALLYLETPFDTIRAQIFAHDSDLFDTVSVVWGLANIKDTLFVNTTNPKIATVKALKAWRTRIVASDSIVDTLVCRIADAHGIYDTVCVVLGIKGNYTNDVHPPVIDSVIVNDIVFQGPANTFTYWSQTIDTLQFSIKAHDPSIADSLFYLWTSAFRSGFLSVNPDTVYKARYICDGIICGAYVVSDAVVDTISVYISDIYYNVDSVKIAIIKLP